MEKDLKDKTIEELEQIVVSLGQPFDFAQGGERAKRVEPKKYLAGYIFSFIHTKNVDEISKITPLSKALRSQLAEQGYFISQLKIISKLTDPDGTIKYLLKLSDGNRIETVLLFDEGPPDKDIRGQAPMQTYGGRRRTLCISTQVGCAINCAFCATGKIKLQRNLSAAEIVDQVNIVETSNGCDTRLVERRTLNATGTGRATSRRNTRIANVVYMGMGEPLLNYDAVVRSIRILNHPAGKNIGIRHITVSTCGIVPAIKKLAEEEIRPRLAISLNAPTDALRNKLMPINTKYPIKDVLAAANYYQRKAKQRVSFEYVLIKGVNDTVLHARMLARLLRDLRWRINLIEFNPHRLCEFEASGGERIRKFADVLKDAGIKTTIRFKKGQSINAACGQLGADWSNA
jgi:23S rRNA (adenine2503-C2)-methyltransferase